MHRIDCVMPSLVSQPLRRYCRCALFANAEACTSLPVAVETKPRACCAWLVYVRSFVGESHARRHRCVGVPSRRFYSSNRPAERYKPTVLLDDICFGEGPRWRNGRLYFSDFYATTTLKEGPDGKMHLVGGGEVRSVTLDGQSEVVAKVPGRPSGLGFVDQKDFCREETLLCVSMTDRRLVAIDLLDGTLSLIANLAKHTGGPCNDCVVCPASGRTWVGNFGWDLFGDEDQKTTRLVLVDLDGSDPRPTGGDVLFPNGGVLANDGETLVVAESFAKRLTAFDVCAVTGELTNQRVWAELPHIPDGIAMDHEGCIWVACPTFDPKDRIGSVSHHSRPSEASCVVCFPMFNWPHRESRSTELPTPFSAHLLRMFLIAGPQRWVHSRR